MIRRILEKKISLVFFNSYGSPGSAAFCNGSRAGSHGSPPPIPNSTPCTLHATALAHTIESLAIMLVVGLEVPPVCVAVAAGAIFWQGFRSTRNGVDALTFYHHVVRPPLMRSTSRARSFWFVLNFSNWPDRRMFNHRTAALSRRTNCVRSSILCGCVS